MNHKIGDRVYSLRHNKHGTIKTNYMNGGYMVKFSENKFDYEFHLANELTTK